MAKEKNAFGKIISALEKAHRSKGDTSKKAKAEKKNSSERILVIPVKGRKRLEWR